jgi:hypothetical protein
VNEIGAGQAPPSVPNRPRYDHRIARAPDNPDAGDPDTQGEPLSTLRASGSGAGVDTRAVARVAGGLLLVGLTVLVVILFVAGVQKNSQITRLRQHGVAVTITSSGCMGLLGGSGSNPAGYACRGSFTLAGRRYNENIPGNTLRPPGTVIRGVSVPGDPALVTTAKMLAAEQASWRVYIAPTVLLIVLVGLALLAGAVLRRGRRPDRP